MNTDLLKKKILDLAIKGKLVEQRPEEGTAEDLYQQIQEEKANLIKEGKLKKEKPLASIDDDEIPFDIPENWKWVRVGSIGSWGAGSTPSRTNSSFYGGDIPWLKTGDLTDGNVDKIPEKITQLALEKCSLKVNPVGSVLIAMYGATIGKLGILTVPATTNQACCACSVFNGMFNKYLFYFLMSRRDSFTKIAVGGAQPNISKEKIVNSIIPLPPLAEQKRIVEKIDLLFSRLHTVENGLVEIDKISDLTKKKILDLAIRGKLVKQRPEECTAEDLYLQIQEEKANLIKEGKLKKEKPLAPIENDDIPFDLPESWKWVRIRDISLLVTKGTTPRGGNVAYTDKGVGFLRAENVNGLTTLNLSNLKFVSEKAHQNELKRSVLEDGDILVTIAGTLGRTAVVQSTDLPLNANQAISIVRMIFKSENMLKYAAFALNANTIQQILLRQTKQTAIPNLTLEIVGNCIIPLPPLAEQKRIVAKVEELLALCDKLKLK